MAPQPDIFGRRRTKSIKDTMLDKISTSDVVLALRQAPDKKLQILKSRHTSHKGDLTKNESLAVLVELIARVSFSDTSGLGVYEEMFRQDIVKFIGELLDKYQMKEELSDYLRRKSAGHGSFVRRAERPVFLPR